MFESSMIERIVAWFGWLSSEKERERNSEGLGFSCVVTESYSERLLQKILLDEELEKPATYSDIVSLCYSIDDIVRDMHKQEVELRAFKDTKRVEDLEMLVSVQQEELNYLKSNDYLVDLMKRIAECQVP